MTTQAHPPSEAQQLADARIAIAQGIVRITELEAQLTAYRRAYGALHSAVRGVLSSAEMAHGYTDDHTVVGSEALRELARCVSSNGGDMP